MTSPSLVRMSRVVSAWLRMDNEVNQMMIIGVWLLRPAITVEALRQRVTDKVLKYPRFRQKVLIDALGASWVDDEHFDVARHVVVETLPRLRGQGEREALQQRCAELASTRLDPDRPLWQYRSIKDLADVIRRDGGRLVSILGSYENVPAGCRKVYIRMHGIERSKLPALKQELSKTATLLYLVDHRENKREVFV